MASRQPRTNMPNVFQLAGPLGNMAIPARLADRSVNRLAREANYMEHDDTIIHELSNLIGYPEVIPVSEVLEREGLLSSSRLLPYPWIILQFGSIGVSGKLRLLAEISAMDFRTFKDIEKRCPSAIHSKISGDKCKSKFKVSHDGDDVIPVYIAEINFRFAAEIALYYRHTFCIFKDLNYRFSLGSDFLRAWSVVDIKKNKVLIEPNNVKHSIEFGERKSPWPKFIYNLREPVIVGEEYCNVAQVDYVNLSEEFIMCTKYCKYCNSNNIFLSYWSEQFVIHE